jgi:zinc protease
LSRELYKLVYGQNSIYTRSPTLSGVASITAPDLAQHLATWQRPDAALLGLVGDFETSDMMKTVQEVIMHSGRCSNTPPQHLH